MNSTPTEYFEEQNALFTRIEGKMEVNGFLPIYKALLAHPKFSKNVNLIWEASKIDVQNFKISDFSEILAYVKKTMPRRGLTYSAWVLSKGADYHTGCIINATLGATIDITFEIFNNLDEAKDWVSTMERGKRYSLKKSPIL